MDLLINPKSKVIEDLQLSNLIEDYRRANVFSDPSEELYDLISDRGRFAAMSGYDAIKIDRRAFNSEESFYIVLNRSSLAKVMK